MTPDERIRILCQALQNIYENNTDVLRQRFSADDMRRHLEAANVVAGRALEAVEVAPSGVKL